MANSHINREVCEERKKYVQQHNRIRLMKPEDVDQCLDIFRDHGLGTSAHGLRTFREIEPNGCHVLTPEDDDTEVIAFTAVSKFDPRAAIVSFYGTKPGYQGLGLGIKVWREMMKFLEDVKNIGLSASPAEVSTYRNKSGFIVTDPHCMLVFDSNQATSPENIAPSEEEKEKIKILALDDVSWKDILTYDAAIVGFDRERLLKLSLYEPDTVALVAVDESGHVVGYGAMKPTNMTGTNKGFLGPLYADNSSVAKVLMYNLMNQYPNSIKNGFLTFILDSQADAITLAKKVGLKEEFSCPKLYTKEIITGVNYDKVYGLLSPGFSFY